MAIQVLSGGSSTPLERLVDDYLANCAARGLSLRSVNKDYGYALHAVFLPWCETEGITHVKELNGRVLDRFTASLHNHRKVNGQPLSKYSVHTYIRPVRQMLTWAGTVGEDVQAKPQLPRRSKPVRDALTRDEIDRMERAMLRERDKLIIRVLADCGLRLDELRKLSPSDIVRSGRQAFLRVLGKRARVRDVPVMPQLLRRLERLAEARPEDRTADRLFIAHRCNPQGMHDPLTDSGIYKVVVDAAAIAHIDKKVYPHLLRHSWMTEMLRNGMSPIQLSLIAGASPEVIASCYTHLTKDDAYTSMLRVLSGSSR
jgi:integrase/recombinase XerD